MGKSQPWIHSSVVDGWFILFPAFGATLLALASAHWFPQEREMPGWTWVLLVLFVDVAHVYSTLFRTYFDREEMEQHATLYWMVPLLCWVVGAWLYSMGALAFWRVLAYLAVFHFVRQQYGFLRIYARGEKQAPWDRWLDQAAIYSATLYPLLFWHTHLPRNFRWFIDGDFASIPWVWLDSLGRVLYGLILAAYLLKELGEWRRGRFNLPKNVLLAGTYLSWWVGIVVLNGDLAFTAANVIAHGIPYMALIWIFGYKKSGKDREAGRRDWGSQLTFWAMRFIPLYLGLMVLFAFLEEGFWDGLVWRDHSYIFQWFRGLSQVVDKDTLAWLVPFLALPQSVHYVLDGFIWRLKSPKKEWRVHVFKLAR